MSVHVEIAADGAGAAAGNCREGSGARSSPVARIFITGVIAIFSLTGAYRIWTRALPDAFGLASDVRGPFLSARAWARGLNPYDPQVQIDQWRQIRSAGDQDLDPVQYFEHTPSLYPPPTLALLAPLTLLPWPVVRIEWLLQNCALAVLSYLAFCDMLRLPLKSWRAQLLAAIWLSMGPFVVCLHLSNPTGLAVMLDFLVICAVIRDRQILAGVLLGISTIMKPQLSGALLLFYFLRPAWKTAFVATGIGLLATIVGVGKLALDHVSWSASLRATMATASKPGGFNDASRLNPSAWQMVNIQYLLYGFLHNRSLVNFIAALVTLLLAALFAAVWLRSQSSAAVAPPVGRASRTVANPAAREMVAASIPLLISLMPIYHRYYDCLVLVIPLACGIALIGTELNSVAWFIVLSMAPFIINWPYLLDGAVTHGHVPARIASSWWWQALVMPCQVWVLLALILVLLEALRRLPAELPIQSH